MTADVVVRDTDVVPRRPPRDNAGPDEWAAWRVAYERERRGWSLGELARRVTAAGAPIQHQAIWQIENREPPRRISLSEAIAFSYVFELEDVAALGQPPAEVARDVVNEIRRFRKDLRSDANELIEQLRYIRTHAEADPDIWREAVDDLRYQIAYVEEEIAGIKSALAVESASSEEIEAAEQQADARMKAALEAEAAAGGRKAQQILAEAQEAAGED